jgi:hypothetical protein
MKIDKARAAARLLFILLRLGILSEKRYRRLIDYLTIRSLKAQMEDRHVIKDNSSEDS